VDAQIPVGRMNFTSYHVTTCKHCSEGIRHFDGQLWHDSGSVFPQYCQAKYGENGDVLPSQLHEPAAPQLAPPFGEVQEHDQCPKCKQGWLEKVIHRYGDGVSNAPDCSWLLCLDCGWQTDPE
jgi:hypothetical protein